jgi:hypothetical protein
LGTPRFKPQAARATLRLYNAKADKLAGLSFTQAVQAGLGYTISGKAGQPVVVERHGPNAEAIDAFILTYRLFVQDNESLSFKNMEKLYQSFPFDSPWKQGVANTRATVNAMLDRPTNVIVRGINSSRRHVHDTFLWGVLAHSNRRFMAQYNSWSREPDLLRVLEAEFTFVLADMLGAIQWMTSANVAVLPLLRAKRG